MVLPTAIGIDIGGTATKMGLVSHTGQILHRIEIPTPQNLATQTIVDLLTENVAILDVFARQQSLQPAGIGISICGYLTPSGKVPDYVNLHALDHFPLVDHFSARFQYPVLMDNDMNAGVLGEYHFGGGQGVDRLMVMTVGTGIGMAVMLDGQVIRLSGGTVGNPGHIIVNPDGPVCVAGCRGCLESLASAGPIIRRAEDTARAQRETILAHYLAQKGSLTPEDVYHAAEAGDPAAQDIWAEVGRWLGRGLAGWVEIFAPHVVIVGGGVAKAGHWLIDPLEREMRRTGEPYFASRVREIKQSQLGKDLAMLGAATYHLFPKNAPRWQG